MKCDTHGARFKIVGMVSRIPIIHDLDDGRSVTNDAENVVPAVLAALGITDGVLAIIYRDTAGVFDALRVEYRYPVGGQFGGFLALDAENETQALERLPAALARAQTW